MRTLRQGAPLPAGTNARGKRRRSTAGAKGTNTGHENAEGMACVGVRLTAQLGDGALCWLGASLLRLLGLAVCCFKAATRAPKVEHGKSLLEARTVNSHAGRKSSFA